MHDIIKRPLVTEKNTLRSNQYNEYAFEVRLTANRKEIRQAVEKLFGVKVVRVNTMTCRNDPRRMGRAPSGRRTLWKKAVVKLREGDKFDFVVS